MLVSRVLHQTTAMPCILSAHPSGGSWRASAVARAKTAVLRSSRGDLCTHHVADPMTANRLQAGAADDRNGEPSAPRKGRARKMKLLLVDDHPLIQDAFRHLVPQLDADATLLQAATAEEGLSQAAEADLL